LALKKASFQAGKKMCKTGGFLTVKRARNPDETAI